MLDLLAAIPQPPVHEEMPKTAETVFNIFIFIPLGIALAIAVRHVLGGKGPVLLYCIVGGAFASTLEPVVDVLGLVYLHEENALGTFTILDRTMPLYIVFVYPWYVGGLGYLAYRLYEYGVTTRMMFVIWAADGVADIFLESPGILLGTYQYYGQQPLNPWGFPLWWAFVNPLMPMIAGALIYKLRPHMDTPWKLLGVIAIIPMADGLANGATAWPMWAVLNQETVSWFVTYAGAAATLGLSLFGVWIVSLVVAVPEGRARVRTLRDVYRFRYLAREPAPLSTPPPAPRERVPVTAMVARERPAG